MKSLNTSFHMDSGSEGIASPDIPGLKKSTFSRRDTVNVMRYNQDSSRMNSMERLPSIPLSRRPTLSNALIEKSNFHVIRAHQMKEKKAIIKEKRMKEKEKELKQYNALKP